MSPRTIAFPEKCSLKNSETLINNFSACHGTEYLNETLNEKEKCLSNEQIRKVVKKVVSKYSADQIGLADFALESMGGSVITSHSSSTYNGHLGLFVFKNNELKRSNSLRKIIQPGNELGDCWSFPGPTGYATIQLSHRILINAITLEHFPRLLSPDGQILSAPKQFQIFSLSEDMNYRQDLVGNFEYQNNDQPIQTFFVETPRIARIVQINVQSNHGNKKYTCIYRLRVHGTLHN